MSLMFPSSSPGVPGSSSSGLASSSSTAPGTGYTPDLTLDVPPSGPPLRSSVTLGGFCEAGSTVSITYMPGSATLDVAPGLNPSSVPCVDCANTSVECGPGPNQRGSYALPVRLLGAASSTISFVLRGNDGTFFSSTITRPFMFVPANPEATYLKASNTNAGDAFGSSVALSGDTLLVGTPTEASNSTAINQGQADNALPGAGAVHVYQWTGLQWAHEAYLKPSVTQGGAGFGSSVALDANTAVVGSPGLNGASPNTAAGAVFVFVRAPGTRVWREQALLRAGDAAPFDAFGFSVDVDADTLVVGAPSESSNATGVDGNGLNTSAMASGAAYVFVRGGGSWFQQAYFKATNTGEQDRFGTSVAVSGDLVVVGAPGEDSSQGGLDENLPDSGAVYGYRRLGNWTARGILKMPTPVTGERMGTSVAMEGETLLAGAPGSTSGMVGRVLAEGFSGREFLGGTVLEPPPGWSEAGMAFGQSVAFGRNALVVGAPGDRHAAPTAILAYTGGSAPGLETQPSGAAFVFSTGGQPRFILKSPNRSGVGSQGDRLGASVSASITRVAAGAPQEDSVVTGVMGNPADNGADGAGAVWAFELGD